MSEQPKVKKSKINWTADKIMSTSALIIALVSLIALFYQLSLAHEENDLIRKQQSASVLPHLSQWFSDTPRGFMVVFGNKGVGPAFIKEVNLTLNDSLKFDNTDHLVRHIVQNTPGLDSIPISTSTFQGGYVLPADKVIEIIVIKSAKGKKIFRDYLNSSDLEFDIIYEDIYGTRWSLSNKGDNESPVLLTKIK